MLHSFREHDSLTFTSAIAPLMIASARLSPGCYQLLNYSKTLEFVISL
ncbi:hypothetical protein [Calothrix sp. NIES-2098]